VRGFIVAIPFHQKGSSIVHDPQFVFYTQKREKPSDDAGLLRSLVVAIRIVDE
jgi:hypothetical protein